MARKNFGVKTYIYPQPVLIIGTKSQMVACDYVGIAGGFLPVVPGVFMKVTGGPRLRQKGQSFMDCLYESI